MEMSPSQVDKFGLHISFEFQCNFIHCKKIQLKFTSIIILMNSLNVIEKDKKIKKYS